MAELDLAKESIQKNEVREVTMGLKHDHAGQKSLVEKLVKL